jgi:hypothetical protein
MLQEETRCFTLNPRPEMVVIPAGTTDLSEQVFVHPTGATSAITTRNRRYADISMHRIPVSFKNTGK